MKESHLHVTGGQFAVFGKENKAFVGVAIENGVSGARESEFVGV